MPRTGVYPCYENQFQIGTGANGTTMSTIADCETFSVAFDNGVEEWHPFEQEGWIRRLLTAKGVTVSVTAKRNVGDAGNDFVALLRAWPGKMAVTLKRLSSGRSPTERRSYSTMQ